MRNLKAKGELAGIQMLRALAAGLVLFHHSLENSNGAIARFSPDWLTTSGAAGVDVFFVISGFIMFYTSFEAKGGARSPGDFLYRRFTRIYPFYWVVCAAMLAVSAAGFLRGHQRDVGDIISSLVLAPSDTKIIGVSWTLVYEMYFYILFAANLFARNRLFSVAVTTAMIVALHFLAALLPPGNWRSFLSNPIPFEFCMGLWLAWAAERVTIRIPLWTMVLPLAAFGVAPLIVPHDTTAYLPGMSRVVAWGIPALLLVATALRVEQPSSWFGRSAVTLGAASYALYLTHPFVMIGYGALLKHSRAASAMPQLPLVMLMMALAAGIAVAAHFLIERPLGQAIKAVQRRRSGSATPRER